MLGRIFLTTLPCLRHNFVGLVAELGGDLPMCGQYLGGRMNLLAVTGGVRGDLRRLRPLIDRSFPDAPRICWLRGLEASRYSCEYPLISGAPLRPGFNFVAEFAQAVGQFRLIDGSGKLL